MPPICKPAACDPGAVAYGGDRGDAGRAGPASKEFGEAHQVFLLPGRAHVLRFLSCLFAVIVFLSVAIAVLALCVAVCMAVLLRGCSISRRRRDDAAPAVLEGGWVRHGPTEDGRRAPTPDFTAVKARGRRTSQGVSASPRTKGPLVDLTNWYLIHANS